MSNTGRDTADPGGLSTSSAAESKNYLTRTLSDRQSCTVYLSLPRHTLDAYTSSQDSRETDENTGANTTFDRLRSIIQVTKTSKETVIKGEIKQQLDHEIRALKQIVSTGHPNVLGMLAEDESQLTKR